VADYDGHRKAAIDRALNGSANASPDERRAAFANDGVPPPMRELIEKVTHHAYKITDDDVASVKARGVSEDEIFELVVCAAYGQATRQLDVARRALAEAIKKPQVK
jgi:alkylhydroperoxidase family enzyme